MACQGRGLKLWLTVAALSGMRLLNPYPAHGQGLMPYMPEIKDPAASAPEKERVRVPDTAIIPSISVSERYDSNVYFVQGSRLEDYVTSVTPRLKVVHTGELIQGTAVGGVT